MVTVISDKKLGVVDSSVDVNQYAYYNPEIIDATDYYSFGMVRLNYNAGIYAYRYGFNGKEKDNDVKGEGEQIDYGARVFDPRVGPRFFSVDPLTRQYPELSPYQFASDNPIANIDLDGLEKAEAVQKVAETVAKPALRVAVKDGIDQGAKVVEMKVAEGVATKVVTRANIIGLLFQMLTLEGDGHPQNRIYVDPAKAPQPDILPVPGPYAAPQPVPQPDYSPLFHPWKDPFAKPEEAPKRDPNDDDDKDNDQLIYRGGAYSDLNFTPRPGKDDGIGPKSGLSTFTTPLQATQGKAGKVQILSVKALRNLGFIVTIQPDGHAGIRPRTQEELKAWVATRTEIETGGAAHPNTKKVKMARIGEIKVP